MWMQRLLEIFASQMNMRWLIRSEHDTCRQKIMLQRVNYVFLWRTLGQPLQPIQIIVHIMYIFILVYAKSWWSLGEGRMQSRVVQKHLISMESLMRPWFRSIIIPLLALFLVTWVWNRMMPLVSMHIFGYLYIGPNSLIFLNDWCIPFLPFLL